MPEERIPSVLLMLMRTSLMLQKEPVSNSNLLSVQSRRRPFVFRRGSSTFRAPYEPGQFAQPDGVLSGTSSLVSDPRPEMSNVRSDSTEPTLQTNYVNSYTPNVTNSNRGLDNATVSSPVNQGGNIRSVPDTTPVGEVLAQNSSADQGTKTIDYLMLGSLCRSS